ncbi:high potential iron-sulfur protein [Aestuariicella hydrocarbonica]|uniref:High-potential iron-sulfur protein n=1 Tax=Pseudomaricurvus hydrocarbonicus TaxID=1470433 RepID=A0A9E5MQ49_9GAMM|nr:high-potential iron-sulfur protein [Aestuariicella hydrocarbonica]NHO68287.1 high potential iron-sulfur protein [Aestuariicella hydrocarbonica]
MKRRTVITVGPLLALFGMSAVSHKLLATDAPLKPLDSSQPTAKALSYVDDIADADPAVYDQSSGARCDNCLHYRDTGQSRGGCAIFPGFSVAPQGWCKGWVKKS